MRKSHRILGLARVKAFAQTHHYLSQFCMVIVLGAATACFTVQARASHEIEALRAYQACFPWGGCHRPLPGASALEVCQNYTIGRVLGRFNPPIFGPDVYACNAPYIFNANGECHPAYCGAYAIVAWAPYCPAGYDLYRFDVATNWYTCLRPGPHEEQQYQIKLSLSTGSPESGTILASVEPGKTTGSMVAKVYNKNGQVVPNFNIKLVVDVKQYSGGHQHDNDRNTKHMGVLAPVAPSTGTVTQDGKVLEGNTGQDGLRFTFTPPAPAGDHQITASCTDGKNCTPEGPDTVWAGVKNLTALYPSEDYVLIGETGTHPNNHYLTNEATYRTAVLASLWRQFLARLFPETDFMLHINDASLERGGIFDTRNNWKAPHAEHCRGTVIDIRANDAPGAIPNGFRKIFEKFAKSVGADPRWEIPEDENGEPVWRLRHYHVRLMGQEGLQCL